MVGSPFSVCQSHAQIAAVAVASLASTFFQSGDLPNAASQNARPASALNSIVPRPSEMLSSRSGFESPSLRHILQGNSDGDSQRDSQTSVPLSPELSQVVTAWEKLPAPLKAAILAIVKTAE
jgi:hypothetical protein